MREESVAAREPMDHRSLPAPVARLCALTLFALLAALPAPAHGAAAVEGTVTLPERPPPPAPNPRYQVKTGAAVGPADPPAAVVLLEIPARLASAKAQKAEIAQHHYQFAPGLLAIERGTIVAFPNLDDEYHSVFSYSKPKRFDLGRYHKDERPAELVFDQLGLVRLYCEIHDHMRGQILVLDTPYFQKTAPDGHYRLEGLPGGHHVLKAWIDEATVWEHGVDLVDGQTLRVDFP
jgi:plastocyanin